ncbi:F-box/kelch-repeat protein At1g80440-like [Rhodamnia argentea]|uniref:F-box/kelch-repeat protein At1g80440-like n=1 Tax=Rhodamnia argentea TaxID=178133 RepID=A0A8B8NVD9_9MYRT|nr:F-box/kelch-repeat protein At1g80440-like [Rhodamnia argentea]
MELIPGLPDDIARECLIRVPYAGFPAMASACKGWKAEIELPQFRSHRKSAGYSQTILVMAQAVLDPARSIGFANLCHVPVYRLTTFEPVSGSWSELPPPPEFSRGFPMFCQLAAAGSDLVVIGGLDPVSWEASSSVYIYSFITATWRRGADMPGVRRSFFGCASDGDGMVFVAGGHDGEKNALRSAVAYLVGRDEWAALPDMARERDECKGIFHGGKFHVIGGYGTETQGRFEKSCEAFDAATRQWGPVREDALTAGTCPRSCVDGDGDDHFYMCKDGDVLALRGSTWRVEAKIPGDVCNPSHVTKWQGKLLVIGSPTTGEPQEAYVLDLRTCAWTNVELPEKFSGHVQVGCCVEI